MAPCRARSVLASTTAFKAMVAVLLLAVPDSATLRAGPPPTRSTPDAGATQRAQVLSTTALAEIPIAPGVPATRTTRAISGANGTVDQEDTAVTGDDPRRRGQWDMMGPGLLVGGTLALLVLAAVGHLASKALLASMLSAALSAVQLARPPPPNRPG